MTEKRTVKDIIRGVQMLDRLAKQGEIDRFEHMFMRNKLFQELVDTSGNRDGQGVGQRLHMTWMAAVKELMEAVDGIPWKWWGRGVHEVQKDYVAEELVDTLHFIYQMYQDMDMSADQVYNLFLQKNDTNFERFLDQDGWNAFGDKRLTR